MSWRTGSKLFIEIWLIVQSVRAAMRKVGIELAEPESYADEVEPT